MHTLIESGGGGNITVPHKLAAVLPGASCSARVERLAAANVFAAGEQGIALDNTDVDGILAALDRLDADGDDWCVLGTGGSARAVVGAASERGARLAVRSRSPERAAAFSAWAASVGVCATEASACQVIVNATPLGLTADDALPATPAEFPSATVALDLTYRPIGNTPWCEAFRAAGCATSDGREVLLQQGAASWRLWFPRVSPPIEVMRAALDGHMA
jgi:shikimate dehydrogenase